MATIYLLTPVRLMNGRKLRTSSSLCSMITSASSPRRWWRSSRTNYSSVLAPDYSVDLGGALHSSLIIVDLIHSSQELRVTLSRIRIDRDHLATWIALEH